MQEIILMEKISTELCTLFQKRGYKNHFILFGYVCDNGINTLIVYPHRIIQGMAEKKGGAVNKNVYQRTYYGLYKRNRFKYDEFIMELIFPTIKEMIEKHTKDYYELQIEFCTASHRDEDGIDGVEDRIIKMGFNE